MFSRCFQSRLVRVSSTCFFNQTALQHKHLMKGVASLIAPKPPTFLHQGNVQNNPGANIKKKKLGRGERSGKGKTSGRGHKGWLARSSKARPVPGFEGGQSGILSAIPKIDHQQQQNRFTRISLDTLQYWISQGKLNPKNKITVKEFYENGCIKRTKNGVFLTGHGALFFEHKVDLEVSEATPDAIERIEALGGTIKAVYYSPRELKALTRPELFAALPLRKELPEKWKELELYVNPNNRGFLAPGEGEDVFDVVERVLRGPPELWPKKEEEKEAVVETTQTESVAERGQKKKSPLETAKRDQKTRLNQKPSDKLE